MIAETTSPRALALLRMADDLDTAVWRWARTRVHLGSVLLHPTPDLDAARRDESEAYEEYESARARLRAAIVEATR